MYHPIPAFDKSLINYCEEYIHRAAQFLAMAGKNYLEDQPDDSNANLAFNSKTSSIYSREIDAASKLSVALNISEWQIQLLQKGKVDQTLDLIGKKKQEVFEWLRDQLINKELNGELLKFIDHYEIPDHMIDHGHAFPEMIKTTVDKWLIMRSDAEILLHDLNKIVGIESEVRIWPHHFDTGTYYSLGEKKTIGAGWAIADELCDNPYLYIYGWNGEVEIDYSSLPELEVGKWIITDKWQGAVLESEVLSLLEDQHQKATSFMKSVSKFLKSELN